MDERTMIHSDDAPRAIGPYSQAIRAGAFVFCSGQIPLDPATGKLVEGDITVQTHRVMLNLQAVLTAAQCSFSSVVKTTILLADMADFAAVNEEYGHFFSKEPPARATYQVAGLPLGSRIEIDAVALAEK